MMDQLAVNFLRKFVLLLVQNLNQWVEILFQKDDLAKELVFQIDEVGEVVNADQVKIVDGEEVAEHTNLDHIYLDLRESELGVDMSHS